MAEAITNACPSRCSPRTGAARRLIAACPSCAFRLFSALGSARWSGSTRSRSCVVMSYTSKDWEMVFSVQ